MEDNSGHTGLSAAGAAWSKGRRVENGSFVAGTDGMGVGQTGVGEGVGKGLGAAELSGGESCVPRVGDLPIRAVPIVPAHLSMAAARKIAELKRATVLFVERDGRLLGTLDEHALVEAPDEAEVAACLRTIELCLGPGTTAERAQELFVRSCTSALPVTAGAFLLGAVSRADVERALRSRRLPKHRQRPASPRAAA
jgi:CBS domain-containing protein